MKNIKIIIAFIMLTTCAKAQYTIHDYDFPNGAYLEDINNELGYFVGTWEGIHNNKKYTFQFVKFLQVLNGDINSDHYYEDELYIKFKVFDLSTNQTLYDDTNVVNYSDFKILQIGMRNGNGPSYYWYKDEQNCNLDVRFIMHKVVTNQNQLKYCYFEYYDADFEGCPYPNTLAIPMFLPKEDMIFTKQ